MTIAILTPDEFAADYNLTATGSSPVAPPTFVAYTTMLNERWDLIAWRVYGDPTQVQALISNNVGLPIRCQLPAGTKVFAPIIAPPVTAAVAATPWQP